jgi:hypothetical protein
MHYEVFKKPLLFWYEILYPYGLNGQSKLLNTFFMLKSYGILNFIIFELSNYFLIIFKNIPGIDHFYVK